MSTTSTPPNILFLFPDQWRWDWLGCEASPFGKVPVRTPHIDALAARGIRFTQCRTNSPLCAPARACLATGMRYERCGVPDNKLDLDPCRTNLFHLLRNEGYRVAVTGKPDLRKREAWKGLDGWTRHLGRLGFTEATHHAGKWDAVISGADQPQDAYMAHLHRTGWAQTHVEDFNRRRDARARELVDASPTPLPREHYTDDFCGQATEAFLDRWGVGDPWMLWVNFPSPHEPLDPPAELLERYDGVTFPPPISPGDGPMTDEDHQAARRAYAALCEGVDEWVGRLIAAVERRGELDQTLIVFASDHGEMLGDHGRWNKQVPFEASVRVPLILAGAGLAEGSQGTVNHDLVELIDISATLLDAAGLAIPRDWDARSLLRDGSPREVQLSSLKDWRMTCDGRWKLIEWDDQPPQLFDVREDPGESRNLADDPAFADVLATLRARSAAERADPATTGQTA